MDPATDRESIIPPKSIQIVHKHPDDAHKRRTDLDIEVFVAESYPIELANRILNFLPKPTPFNNTEDSDDIAGSSSKRAGGILEGKAKKIKAEEEQFKTPERQKKVVLWEDQPFRAPDFLNSVTVLRVAPSALIASRTSTRGEALLTPLPPINQTPSFPTVPPTVSTGRTITPGGNAFSPLPPYNQNQNPNRATRPNNALSSGLFTPSRQARQPQFPPALATPNASPASMPAHAVNMPAVDTPPGSHKKKNPPKLVEFQPVVRSINGNAAKQTVILRHRVEVETLRDVFKWCERSAETGRVESLEGWLVKFRDRERVKDIMEVCVLFGLKTMIDECARTIAKFERFGPRLNIGSGRQEMQRGVRETSVQSTGSSASGMSGGSSQYRNGAGPANVGYQGSMEGADKPIKREPSPW